MLRETMGVSNHMRSNLASVLCLTAGLVLCAAPAFAQNYDPDRVPSDVDAKAREACTPDVMRLCNNYVPDIPEIVACLKRERANLSPACGEIFAVPAPDTLPAPTQKAVKKTSPKKSNTVADTKKPAKAGAPLNLSDTAKATK
jgi:hypothetical protein